eukprot:scaffold218685_cov30-Tisochrysis_lutea.AAC.2
MVRKADNGLKCLVQDSALVPIAEALAASKQKLYYGGRELKDEDLLVEVRHLPYISGIKSDALAHSPSTTALHSLLPFAS